MAPPLTAFSDAVFEAVAADSDAAPEDLRDLVRRQQRLVRDFPDMTVEALVHDWRKSFTEDPLVDTDEDAFFLSVREHVWDDLAGRLEIEPDDRRALRRVNAEQFRASLGNDAERVAFVLTK